MTHIQKRKCENCKEEVRASNYGRHKQRCKKGRKFTKRIGGYCEGCMRNYVQIKSHKCKGRKIRTKYSNCKKCKRRISNNNLTRHEQACGERHNIRRNKSKAKTEYIYN